MKSTGSFPRWRYHRVLPGKIVMTAEENEILGDEWEDSPAAFESEVIEVGSAVDAEEIEVPEKTYKEHMAEWDSKEEKEEKAAAKEKAKHPKKKGHK